MKVLSAETDLGSATNLSNHPVVRVYNSDSSAVTLTRKDASGTVIGTYTIPAGEVIYSQKAYTDTLEGGAALKATAIGYSEMLDIISLGGGEAPFSGITDNLVIHFDAGRASSYAGSGTTWNDVSSSGANATLSSALAANYSSSDSGYFEYTQDITEYATFPLGAAGQFGTGDFTIEFWANVKHTTGSPYIFDFRNATQTSGPRIFIHATTEKLAFHTGTTNLFFNDGSNPAFPVGSFAGWKQYIIRRLGSATNLYINTELKGAATNSDNMNTSFTESQIGQEKDKDNDTLSFRGYLSILRIYKGKALNASERLTNFNADKDRYGL